VQKIDLKKKIKSTLIFIPVFLCISCQGKIEMNQGGAELGNFSSFTDNQELFKSTSGR
jgi:hypothetical protein